MPQPIIIAIIAFFAAILGGVVQAVTSSFRERRAFRWSTNRENYGLFLQSVAGKGLHPIGTDGRPQFDQMGLEATAKILLQGSPAVIECLDVYQQVGVVRTEEDFTKFGDLVAAMRKDIGGKKMAQFSGRVRSILFERKP